MGNKIVVPIDGSENSLNALKYAINIVKTTEGELVLLNVQPKLDGFDLEHRYSDDEINDMIKKNGLTLLQKAIDIVLTEGVKYDTKIRIGIPSIEISTEAMELHAHSIIMASKGIGPEVGKALGSVSFGILHLATCPVTFVPSNLY